MHIILPLLLVGGAVGAAAPVGLPAQDEWAYEVLEAAAERYWELETLCARFHQEIEVTLLSPLEPIHGPDEVQIGRHGLVVEQGHRRGLLLPQVATEQGWSAEVFLEQTCWKAGLPPDAWRQGAGVYRFEGVVFGEG